MLLDIEFKDFLTKSHLAKCSMKLVDFSLHVQNIFILKSKNTNSNFNHFKKQVRYTIHQLLANNYHKMKNKCVYKMYLVDAASELWFGRLNKFLHGSPDVFAFLNGSLDCFPQYMYYSKQIKNLNVNTCYFSLGDRTFVTRKSHLYNRSLTILINDPSYNPLKNKKTFSNLVIDKKELYNYIVENNLTNAKIIDDLFVCQYGKKEDLSDFQQTTQIYEDLYFGINIVDEEKDEELKYSKYNVVFENEDKYYIFNTWHGNLAEIEKEQYNRIKKNLIVHDTSYREMGFIVPKSLDEFKQVEEENERYLSEKSYLHVTICPTFKCNANCAYCFENGVDKNLLMSDQLIQKTAEYIDKHSINRKCKITWFGGEPLMGAKQINLLTELLNEKGISFTSTMITNGLLLDTYIHDIKNRWNCKKIQITLDGIGSKYDVVKRFAAPSFDKIISNIHLCIKHDISISIRINYDSKNCEDYFEIIDYVRNEFKDKVKLYFHDIMGAGFLPPFCVKPNPLLLMFEKMKNVGYNLSLKDLKIRRTYASCAINKPDFVIVEPNGTLTKCEHYVGKPSDYGAGSILDNKKIPGKVAKNMNECSKCLYFPICGGGCYANHVEKKYYGCSRIKGIIIDLLKIYLKERR